MECGDCRAPLSLYTTQSDGSYKLAHSVEHLSKKQNVAGSIPALLTNTSYHSRGGYFSIRNRREVTSIKKDCPAANAATSLHSRRFSAGQSTAAILNFALRNRPGVTSKHVGSNPASPTRRGSSQMVKATVHKLTKTTSLHSRNADFPPRNRMEVTSNIVGSNPTSPSRRASSQMAKATAKNCENTLLSTRVAIHFAPPQSVWPTFCTAQSARSHKQ
jgi:hypothetical protein